MRKMLIFCLLGPLLLSACSPRSFLTRRLAANMIAASPSFKNPQQYVLQTGVLSNKDFIAPEYLVLGHHGWITASSTACPPGQAPPPCWDVLLTPSGVEVVRAAVPAGQNDQSTFTIPIARRELIGVNGISKQGNAAEVDFTWKWVALNEIGGALYTGDVHYRSTVSFRDYDDGWRPVTTTPRPDQDLDDALKNAEPVP